jgi:hypothetical protein
MRSFNPNFIAEKNRRADGPTPINLVEFGFATPVLISDRDAAYGPNLLPNGDMELDSVWGDYGTPTVNERSTEQVHSGTYSRKFTANSYYDGVINLTDTFTTTAGQLYRVSGWVHRNCFGTFLLIFFKGDGHGAITRMVYTAPNNWSYVEEFYLDDIGGTLGRIAIADEYGTYYLDDFAVQEVINYTGLVKQWGFIDSSVGQTPGRGIMGGIEVPDLDLTIINSQATPFSDNFTAVDPLEGVEVCVYQWFEGLPLNEKELIFKGVVRGRPKHDERECRLRVEGIWSKYSKVIGEDLFITAADYPDADPDDIGTMHNICYGSLDKVPCKALSSGAVDTLVGDIDSIQESIELSDASEFPASGTIGLEEEEISYTGKSGNTLTGCTRGANGTTALNHDSGAAVWEKAAIFVYGIAGHPVKSIGDIYVDGVRITALAATYTGQAGNELAGYDGKAVFTVPSRITRQQAVDIVADHVLDVTGKDQLGFIDTLLPMTDGPFEISTAVTLGNNIAVTTQPEVSQGSHSHAGVEEIVTWKFDTAVESVATVTSPGNMIDNSLYSGARFGNLNAKATLRKVYEESYSGPPVEIRLCAYVNPALAAGDHTFKFVYAGKTLNANQPGLNRSAWSSLGTSYNTWTELLNAAATVTMTYTEYVADRMVMEVWVEIKYTPSVSSSAATGVARSVDAFVDGDVNFNSSRDVNGLIYNTGTGDIANKAGLGVDGPIILTGNSVADVEIGRLVTATVDGWQDDAAGTITGTAAALIERPDHVFHHQLTYYLGFPSPDIDIPAATSTFFSTNGYKFALLINRPIPADRLLARLAVQCRSRFIVTPYGTARLLVRQTGQTSGHSIVKNEVKGGSMTVNRSPMTDLVNLFTIRFDRDWTQDGDNAYRAATEFTDATSVATYGEQHLDGDEFDFESVRDAAMVDHVGAFWLDYLKDVREMPEFAVYLDNMEIEPGDIIDLTHTTNNMAGFVCEVIKTTHHPGSARRKLIDHIEVLTIEN